MIKFSWQKNNNNEDKKKNAPKNTGEFESLDAPPVTKQVPPELKKLLSLREASELSGYHKDYLGQLIRGGDLHGIKKGRSWFTTQDALYNFLFERKPEHLVRLVQEGEFPDIANVGSNDTEEEDAPDVQDVKPPQASEEQNTQEVTSPEDIVPSGRPLQGMSIRDSLRNFFTTGRVLAGSLGLLLLIALLIGGSIWFFGNRDEGGEQTQTGDIPVIDLSSVLQVTPSGNRARIERLVINGTLQLDGPLIFESTTRPDDPSVGQVYYDADLDQLFIFDGTEWVPFFTGDVADFITNFITPADLTAGLATKVDLRPDLLTAPQVGNIDITGTISAGDFTGTTYTGTSATFSSLSLATNLLLSSADSGGLAQLALLENTDTTTLLPIALNISSEVGGIDVGIDISDEDINTAIDLGDNAISASGTTIDTSELILLSGRGGILVDSQNISNFALTSAAPGGGLEVIDEGTTLLASCTSGELLKWNGTEWECAIDTTGGGSNDSLQSAYGRGNIITTTDARDILFTLSDTATDSDFIVDLLGAENTFEVHDAGSTVLTISDSGYGVFQNSADSTVAYQFLDADGGSPVFNIDTENERVGIGTNSPSAPLDIELANGLAIQVDPLGIGDSVYIGNDSGGLNVLEFDFAQGQGINSTANLFFNIDSDNTNPDTRYIDFRVNGQGAAGGSSIARILESGEVGIGTVSPQELLHISAGDTGDSIFRIEADEDNNGGGEDDNPKIHFIQDGASTSAFVGLGGCGGDYLGGSSSICNALYLETPNFNPIEFATNNTLRMIIDGSGDTGIGTNNPNELLTLEGVLSLFETSAPSSTANYGKLYVDSSDSSLYFLDDSGTATNLLASSGLSGTGSNGQVTFWTGANTISGDSDFFWDNSTKELGIGTNSPNGLLHVSSGTAGDAILRLESDTDDNDENDNPRIIFEQDGGNVSAILGLAEGVDEFFADDLSNAFFIEAVPTDSIQFATGNTARMTILDSGEVGIGNNNPNELLTLEGALSLFEISAPSSASNYGKLYVKSSDSDLYFLDDSGVETNLLAAAGGNSVLLQPASAQSAGNTTTLIWINETSAAAPNLLELEVAGSDAFVVSNSGSITNGTIPWTSVTSQPNIISSLEGVVNDEGNIDLIASGTNLTVSGDDVANTITFDIDETVLAGEGIIANTTALDINTGNGIQIDTDAVALGPLTANWDQTGAFDIVLNNSASDILMLEAGASPTWYGTLAITDLSSDQTYTFPDDTGVVCLSSGNCVGGGGGGAPADADYLVLSLNSDLTDERAFNALAGGDIVLTDNGANANLDISVSESPTFSTSITTPLLTNTGTLTIQTTASAGDDDLIIGAAGTERARILESGFFGVGNVAPDSLFVAGTADCTGANGEAWDCMVVDTTNDVGANSDIAFDAIGTAWIAFQDESTGDLLAAQYVGSGGDCTGADGGQWNCFSVEGTSNVGHDISIAVDMSGNPWIAHRDFSSGDLLVARYVGSGGDCDDTAWDCDVVDSTNNVGWYTDIEFDSTGTAWISFLDLTNDNLRVAQYVGSGGDCTGADGGEWDCSVVDSSGAVGHYTSIDFDSNDNPWVSFQDNGNGDLKTAEFVGGGSGDCSGADGADWDCSVVDSTNVTGIETSIIIDSSDDAWISYRDSTSGNLRVAHHVGSGGDCTGADGGAWDCQTVESIDGGTTSIDLDREESAWISFTDGGNLRTAQYVGSGGDCSGTDGAEWDCSTIEAMGDTDSAIAVDNANKPWISYRDVSTDGDLEVAKLGSFFRVNNFGNIIEATGLTSSGNIDISTGQILGGSPFIFEGGTDDNIVLTMSITDPTAQRTITFPDASGNIVLNTTSSAITGVSAFVQGGNTWGEDAILGTTDAFDLAFSTSSTERARIHSSGKISFGTSSINTTVTLFEIVGTAAANTTEAIVCIDDTGTANDCSNISAGGAGVRLSLAADETVASGNFDVAETFPAKEDVDTAEIVSVSMEDNIITSAGESHPILEKATKGTKGKIIGVVSTNPGFLAGGGIQDPDYIESNVVPVALSGRVPVKVTNENGSIKRGDYITASSTPGAGMKATEAGRVVGIALEPLNCLVLKDVEGNVVSESACSGEIVVFINPHYYMPASSVANTESTEIFSADITQNTQGVLASLQDLFRVAGMHIRNGIVAFRELFIERLTTREFVIEAEPPAFKDDPVVGEGSLKAGEKEVFVENDNVSISSRVLVTLTSLDEKPITLAVTEKREGAGFMLSATSAPTKDLSFDYWIVGVNKGEAVDEHSSENSSDSIIQREDIDEVYNFEKSAATTTEDESSQDNIIIIEGEASEESTASIFENEVSQDSTTAVAEEEDSNQETNEIELQSESSQASTVNPGETSEQSTTSTEK